MLLNSDLPRRWSLWEEPRGQARPGTAPLQGPLDLLPFHSQNRQCSWPEPHPDSPLASCAWFDCGPWEKHKPFLTQDHSAEAETPVCLQMLRICLLGEMKERCPALENIGRVAFCWYRGGPRYHVVQPVRRGHLSCEARQRWLTV